MPTYGPEMEGRTATSKDGKTRIIIRNGEAVADTSYVPPAEKTKTSSDDQKALRDSSARAMTERDAMRVYNDAEQAVRRLDTGPMQSWWMDTITPEQDGGFWDSVGGVLGTPARLLYKDQDFSDRDHLRTVNADASIAASANMKGAASDRDMAMMRLTGVQTGKTREENLRVIGDARLQSSLEQWRARYTSRWISRYGSLSAPAPSGASFQEALQAGERKFTSAWRERFDDKGKPRRRAPTPPPRRSQGSSPAPRRSQRPAPRETGRVDRSAPTSNPLRSRRVPSSRPQSRTVTIDLNGNEI